MDETMAYQVGMGRLNMLIHWLGLKGRTVAALDERTIEEFVGVCPSSESMPVPTVWPHAQEGHPEGCASVPPLCPVC